MVMHIFSDESGGTGSGDPHFLVAAVAIDHVKARRLIKKLREKTGIKGEVKGTDLTPDQRETAIDLIIKRVDAGATVCCRRDDAVGGWALSTQSDQEIWTHLTAEACEGLIRKYAPRGVSPDGGRHPGEKDRLQDVLQEEFLLRCGCRLPVKLEPSHGSAGVQIADIISNTVNKAISGDLHARGLVRAMIEAGFLEIEEIRLDGTRQSWMDSVMEMREGAEQWLFGGSFGAAAPVIP